MATGGATPTGVVRAGNGGPDDAVLTPEGHAALEAEHRRLTAVVRPAAAARLAQALEVAGDLADNSEYFDARAELDLVEERVARLERRLRGARVVAPGETTNGLVSFGSHVVLEDLDEAAREEYVLVSSAEADPGHGRISELSPVGRAIMGHRKGDVVEAHAPCGHRHLRIADVRGRHAPPKRRSPVP